MNEKKDRQRDNPFSLPSPAESKAGFDYCDAFNEPRVCRFHEPSLSNTPPRPEAKWSFDHRNISPEPHKDPTATRINDSGLTGRYDEQRNHERHNYRGTVGPGFLRPREPATTKEFLKGSEVTNPDPFHFEAGLTGRYDESRRAFPKVGRGPNLVRVMRGMPRPATFPENHAINVERYGEAPWEGSEYCHSCESYVPKDQMVEDPQPSDQYLDPVCVLCAENIKRSLHKCPSCGNFCSPGDYPDGDFPRCSRCGRSGCDCLNLQPVPYSHGVWITSEFDHTDIVCADCYKEVQEEHDRRREEELERSNQESMSTESTNKQTEE